jgi:hypothetical protein
MILIFVPAIFIRVGAVLFETKMTLPNLTVSCIFHSKIIMQFFKSPEEDLI